MTYDSTQDTIDHIAQVQEVLERAITDLRKRSIDHDNSKLREPEKEVFDTYTPKLAETTYGSDEYKAALVGMREGLDHHYAVNDHHPEHFQYGIQDMNLMQLTEMLCDWLAATRRHKDGDIYRSIEQNQERFGYGDEMKRLLLNTVAALERG